MDEIGKDFKGGDFIGTKFKLEEKIGRGSFGLVWKCINIENQEQYAIKFEKRQAKQSSMLVREIKVMIEMKEAEGFPRLISYGKDEEHNYVVMSFMGRNMDSILKKCTGKFSTQTLCNISQQMISRLESLHNKNLIHRDIKPDNYVIGHGNNVNIVNLIDFGLAKYYKDSDGNHIPFIKKRGMIGTARYASTNAHLGHEQSRRDDLEGLGYVLLYFAKGKLPWQNIYAESKEEKYEKIKNMKQNQPLEQMCENAPSEFVLYFKHVKSLGFTDTPDYTYLKSLFKKIMSEKGLEATDHVDWQNLQEYKYRKKNKPSLTANVPDNKSQQKQSLKSIDQSKQQITQQPKPISQNQNNINNSTNVPDKNQNQIKNNNNITNKKEEIKTGDQKKIDNKNTQQQQINNNKNTSQNIDNSIAGQGSGIIQNNDKQQPLPDKKMSLPNIPTKQLQKRGSLLQPQQQQQQGNTLQLPGQSSLVNAIGNSSIYSQTAQYSVQGEGGGQSWNTRQNQYMSSQFSDDYIDIEVAPGLDRKMGANLTGLGIIKTDIKRKSAQLSQLDVLNLGLPTQEDSKLKNQKQQQIGIDSSEDEAIQEEGHLGSYLGENITTDKQTVKGNRKLIQVLQIQSSYKNNEDTQQYKK